MKVLLVSTNQLKPVERYQWIPVVPLGVACIAASTRRAGHEAAVLDLCFQERPGEILASAIGSFRPDVIGVSFRNIEMMTYFRHVSFLDELRSAVDTCRACTRAPLVLGGSGTSVMPAEILRFTGVELAVAGEGEHSFPQLLSRIERGADLSDVPGLVRAAGGAVHRTPPLPIGDLSTLEVPARELLDHGRYIEAGGCANIQTKRGCPFRCIYCTYPLIEGSAVRCRPPREVADEFALLYHRYGIDNVYVVDNQFNFPLDHAMSVCEELLSLRNEVKVWWSCMLNPGHVSGDLVFLLRMARCAMVDLSIESASDGVLESLGKNFRAEEVRSTIVLLKKYGLPFNTWVLFGGPGETKETVRETLELLAGLEVPRVVFGVGIRVCPGTRIERLMRDEGKLASDDDLLNPVYYLSMNAGDIVEIVKPYCEPRPDWRIAAL